MKKLMSYAIVIAMLASTACGEATSSHDTEPSPLATDSNSVNTADALDARQLVNDELPAKDFSGALFTILTDTPVTLLDNYVSVEEDTGDVIDSAVWARNRSIEERFNVNIEVIYADANSQETNKKFSTSVNAGDDEYSLYGTNIVRMGMVLQNDYYVNLYDVPNVNFEKPWWSASTIEDLSYDGKCFIAVGDLMMSALEATYCMYYNKRLAEDYHIPDIYEMVLGGTWTIDKLINLTKDIYSDVNSNDSYDEEDFYGFCANVTSNANTFLWAFGNRVISKENGQLSVVYKSEKTGDIISKLCSMYNDNPGISYNLNFKDSEGNTQWPYPREMFLNSKTIFATGQICMALTSFRDMQDDYGIIPYPKWDENQSAYYTMCDGSHSGMAIPVTVVNLEMVGTVTEALCAETYKTVVPAYYDKALKVKGARDETSIEILDMIVEGRVFDMGYVYDGWKGASFLIQSFTRSSDSQFESTWASKESAILAHYQEVIEYFENYEK